MLGLEGRHALVTGAGGGIGRTLVAAFRAAGATVSAFDARDELLAELDVAFRAAFDIRDPAAAKAAVAALERAVGVPDILVDNAGWTRGETFALVDEEVWADEVDLNLNGTFYVTNPVLKGMAAKGGGAVVMVSSVNGLAHFGNPAYAAAKSGMIAYAKAIAVEHGDKGIRANVVCPGSVRTPAWDHRIAADPTVLADVSRFYPLGRIVEPAEVANAVLFLASPLASGITGAVVPVDAGLTAGNVRFVRDILERN